MNQIVIYGAPGVGKTTVSDLLSKQIGVMVIHGDFIKDFPGTKSAWRRYGLLTRQNVVKGLFDVREFMNDTVMEELAKHKEFIIEGSFIDPAQLTGKVNLFLIVTDSEASHRRHFFEPEHRTETEELMENFLAVRLIQDYLIEEAQKLNIQIIHNNGSTKETLKALRLTL